MWGQMCGLCVSPHLLSLSCVRDSLLGLTFNLTNCVGFHTATKERKIVSRDSTHLQCGHIPRCAGPSWSGCQAPLQWGRQREGRFLPIPLLCPVPAHTRTRTANPGTAGGKLLPSPGQPVSIWHPFPISCFSQGLMSQIPTLGAADPLQHGSLSQLPVPVPAKRGVPSALHDNASIQTHFLPKANKPCDTGACCQLSSCCALDVQGSDPT